MLICNGDICQGGTECKQLARDVFSLYFNVSLFLMAFTGFQAMDPLLHKLIGYFIRYSRSTAC